MNSNISMVSADDRDWNPHTSVRIIDDGEKEARLSADHLLSVRFGLSNHTEPIGGRNDERRPHHHRG